MATGAGESNPHIARDVLYGQMESVVVLIDLAAMRAWRERIEPRVLVHRTCSEDASTAGCGVVGRTGALAPQLMFRQTSYGDDVSTVMPAGDEGATRSIV